MGKHCSFSGPERPGLLNPGARRLRGPVSSPGSEDEGPDSLPAVPNILPSLAKTFLRHLSTWEGFTPGPTQPPTHVLLHLGSWVGPTQPHMSQPQRLVIFHTPVGGQHFSAIHLFFFCFHFEHFQMCRDVDSTMSTSPWRSPCSLCSIQHFPEAASH